ncbi:MAG: DUF1624 domain-containing protein [Bacteroidetes bacterium]|nr:DUF1624 domain-containing protein [Bacteroidota bacterium]
METRDNTVDVLRGIAIFSMIASNMAAYNYLEPHAFVFKVYGSIAAPCFIFLAGMMVSYTAHIKSYPFNYYLLRGTATLIVAALIDFFLWRIIPFVTFDVLYLIGLAMPLIYVILKLPKYVQLISIVLIFVVSSFLQKHVGYIDTPNEARGLNELKGSTILHQFFIDGWFPLFPWLGVSLLGAFFGKMRITLGVEKLNKLFLIYGLCFFIAGLALWIVFKPALLSREGYSELFYPPTIIFMMTFLGVILLLLNLLYQIKQFKILYFFSIYGRSSLLMYILHTTFIVFIFNRFFVAYTFFPFVLLYLAHAIILWVICLLAQKLKKKNSPFLLKFLLGG